MATNKYISLSKLSTFLDKLKTTFALLSHTHTLGEITNYHIDVSLSPQSTNPVTNAAITSGYNILLTNVNKKLDASDYVVDTALSDTSTNPVQNKVLNAEFDSVATAMNVLESAIDEKTQVQIVIWEDDD